MKPWLTAADIVSLVRLPLAAIFPFVRAPLWQLVIVAAASASDVVDGILARRFGGSRAGSVLDPIADKAFMAVAFITVARRGLLAWYELIGVLLRDLLAILGFVGTWLLRRPVAVPARAGGKAVTIAQLLTLAAAILEWRYVGHLAWATAGIAVYAIWDYAAAGLGTRGTGRGTRVKEG